MRILVTIILFLPNAFSQWCEQLPESVTMSYLHSVYRNSRGYVRLCSGFSISGERCDVNAPFVVNTTHLHLYCDNVYGAAGLCEISCPGSHFTVEKGKTLLLDRILLKGATSGSVIVNQGTLYAKFSTWEGNVNEGGSGAAIYVESGSGAFLWYSEILGNNATEDGGGMYIGGDVTIRNGIINNNISKEGRGGGVFIADESYVSIGQCDFNENVAQEGPAIYSETTLYRRSRNEGCGNAASTDEYAECNGIYDVFTGCSPFQSICSPPSEI